MSNTPIKSADRVLDVLELLVRRGNSASHSEIANALDIPKSSLTGLLKNLMQRNYLQKNFGENTYQLGSAFFNLMQQGKVTKNILEIAHTQLRMLTSKTKEASAFYLFKGDHVERVLGLEANYPLSYRMQPNVKFPLYSAAAGKAILNALSVEEQNNYFKNTQMKALTHQTITDEKKLKAKLKVDTRDGITISMGENSVGVIALATPIQSSANQILGALSIVIPEVRFHQTLDDLSRSLLRLAKQKIENEINHE
jgi:DNA-binding IclR family transcriptional regulator